MSRRIRNARHACIASINHSTGSRLRQRSFRLHHRVSRRRGFMLQGGRTPRALEAGYGNHRQDDRRKQRFEQGHGVPACHVHVSGLNELDARATPALQLPSGSICSSVLTPALRPRSRTSPREVRSSHSPSAPTMSDSRSARATAVRRARVITSVSEATRSTPRLNTTNPAPTPMITSTISSSSNVSPRRDRRRERASERTAGRAIRVGTKGESLGREREVNKERLLPCDGTAL